MTITRHHGQCQQDNAQEWTNPHASSSYHATIASSSFRAAATATTSHGLCEESLDKKSGLSGFLGVIKCVGLSEYRAGSVSVS